MNVIVQTDDGPVSLLVDEIGDVLEVSDETFELPPETLRHAARDLIVGVYKLDERLLLILDAERTVNVTGNGQPQRAKDHESPSGCANALDNHHE